MEKLYVIIRADLPIGDQAVQAGHAVSLFAGGHPGLSWIKQTFVYVTVPDLPTLCHLIRKVYLNGMDFVSWQEPDLNFDYTAIAVMHDGNKFDKLKLMGS